MILACPTGTTRKGTPLGLATRPRNHVLDEIVLHQTRLRYPCRDHTGELPIHEAHRHALLTGIVLISASGGRRCLTFRGSRLHPCQHHLSLCSTMASAIQAGSPTYPPPPTFSHNSTEPTMNGVHHSHSALNSFDGPHSMASTPTPTPPASRHQPNIPYHAPYANMNGTHSQQHTPRHYHDLKPNVPQQHYAPGQHPQIYTVCLPLLVAFFLNLN